MCVFNTPKDFQRSAESISKCKFTKAFCKRLHLESSMRQVEKGEKARRATKLLIEWG